jgi:TonB family protein
MSIRRVTALIVMMAGGMGSAQDRPKSLEQEAKRQVGRVATLCGRVVGYQCRPPDRTSLLALDKPSSSAGVSVAISQENRGKFGTLFEQRLVLREVCATGPVEKRKNRYLIRVEDPGQLSFQDNPTPVIPFDAESVSACDVGVDLPKLLREVKPTYTQAAIAARIQGAVLLEGLVLTDGQVANVRVLRSLDSTLGLDTQAIRALKVWRFSPGTLEGKPVPVVVTVELSFRLK